MAYFHLLVTFLHIWALLVSSRAESLDVVLKLSTIEHLLTQSKQVTSYTSGSYLYPLKKSWLEDLKCYIQKNTRKFTDDMSCNSFPRPLTMSRDDDNDYVEENLWKQLVKIFGVDKSHDLSRIHAKDYTQVHYVTDYIMTKVDVVHSNHDIAQLGMFPSLWMFPKEEHLGYIMTQLRHYYNIPSKKRSRLWYAPSLPTSWLVSDLNKTVCNVRGAINPSSSALNGVSGSRYIAVAQKTFANAKQYQHHHYHHYSNRNPLNTSYAVSEFTENAGCSPIHGLLVLEVENTNGKWPTKRYPQLVPKNFFDLPVGINIKEEDIEDINKRNTSESIDKWVKEIIDKIEMELKEEMLSVYDVAKGKGEEKCEKLEDRESYMHALEEGLKTLQEQTNGLKRRLQELRGYKRDL